MALVDHFGQEGWYEENFYWRKDNSDDSDGKGDLIYNTCGKIVYDQDTSDWARKALLNCFILLLVRKRWPDYMEHPMDAKNWFWRIINRTLNKLFDTNLPFRAQGRMTRDPFIAFYAACVLLDQQRKIELVTIPRFLYRPSIQSWYKFLRDNRLIQLRLYRFWEKFNHTKREFVQRLKELREIAINYKLNYNV